MFRTLFETVVDRRIPQTAGNFEKAIGIYILKGDAAFRY